MTGWIANAPAGVFLSPSRLLSETPRAPRWAVHAPSTAIQHSPDLRQRRSEAVVERRVAATTVTSCLAEPVEASSFARFTGQSSGRASPGLPAAARLAARKTPMTSAFTIRRRVRSEADEGAAARDLRRVGGLCAAVRGERLSCDGGPASALLASRLPGRAVAPSARPRHVLGLRPTRPYRRPRRERGCGSRARARLLAPVRRPVSDPPAAPDRRLRGQGRAFARGRQHRCLQLPLRRRPGPRRWSAHAYGEAIDVNP